MNWTDIAV